MDENKKDGFNCKNNFSSNILSGTNKFLVFILIIFLIVVVFELAIVYKNKIQQNEELAIAGKTYEQILKDSKIINLDNFKYDQLKIKKMDQYSHTVTEYYGIIEKITFNQKSFLAMTFKDDRNVKLTISYPKSFQDRFVAYEHSTDPENPIPFDQLSSHIKPGRKFMLEEKFDSKIKDYEQAVIGIRLNLLTVKK